MIVYDTLNLMKIETQQGRLPDCLEGVQEIVKFDTGEIFHKGRLSNFSVSVFPNRMYIRGSLSVYHLGTNLKTLTRKETAHGIEHLSDVLHMNMSNASVSKLDIGTNCQVDRAVRQYLR